jgi:hypothetical protein
MTVGNGLVSTFTRTTTVATWIGFQIVLGSGRGLGMQTVSSQRRSKHDIHGLTACSH